MAAYVAFLRGINVGGRTVTNDRFADIFAGAGLGRAQPYLSTGNVIFTRDGADPAAREELIEDVLLDALGYTVPTFVRSDAEVAAIAAHDPFPRADGKLHVGLLRDAPERATVDELLALAQEDDRVAVDGRELYWHVAGRFKDSALSGSAVARVLGDGWTVRTANTVRRISAKLAG
jgi:uncharacterized protein (DUF1697 family)